MSYIRRFVHGAVAGTVIGLCVAPQTGDRTRKQLKAASSAAREGAISTGRALQRVAPMATGAVHMVERARHHGAEPAPHENGSVGATRV